MLAIHKSNFKYGDLKKVKLNGITYVSN